MSLDETLYGGIIGGEENEWSRMEVQYCYNKGTIKATGGIVGGIVR